MKPNGNPSFRKIGLVALMLASYADNCVLAAPQGGHVVSGSASFQQQGNITTITAGNRSIINYTGFNIAPGETVRFVQPNAGSTVLNRVLSPNPTSIFGQIQANGIVYIINPYGVYFQNGAVLNVGGLYAAAGTITNQDFTAGRIHFTDLAGDVRNDGVLAADSPIALLGSHVVNNGTVSSAHGSAALISANDVYVGTRNGNIYVQSNGGAKTPSAPHGSITNGGTVKAPSVMLGAGDLYSTAIVNTGLLQGRQIAVNAGTKGSATVGGRLNASSARGKGGSIQVTGGKVALHGAALNAGGQLGGGSVRVGGDFHGGGTLLQSTTTTVDAATTINASSTGARGDGGTVVLWSSAATTDLGTISARGGSVSGNGGSVEVSSHNDLGFYGVVDTRAPGGRIGSLLLDPSNIEVTAGGAVGALPTNPVNDPTAAPPTLTISQASLEASATAFTLSASNDIRIDAMSGGKLTLQADATFIAGVNTAAAQPSTGSFVMASLTDTIVDPGHNVTIQANGVSVGAAPPAGTIGTGINGASPYAIEVGSIDTSNNAGNGGGVILSITGTAAVAPVHVAGSITTSSSFSQAGGIDLSGTSLGIDGSLSAIGRSVSGNVNLTASGAITVTGDINTSGSGPVGAGGTVTILTQPGGAPGGDTLAGINTSAATGTPGRILIGTDGTTVFAPASLTLTGALVTTGGTTGGAILINAGGAINGNAAATFDASAENGVGGTGGNITLANTGTGIILGGSLTSNGSSAGGNLGLQSSGAISLLSVDTSSSGTGGNITVTGAGLTSGALTSSGLSGGAVTLTSGDALSVTGTINSSATTGTGGAVQLLTFATAPASLTPVTTVAINSGSSAGSGGSITIGPAPSALTPTSITINSTLTSSAAGTGGNISLRSGGAIQVSGDISAGSTTAGNGGAVTILTSPSGAGGGDSLAAIDTSAVGGNGGSILIGTDGTTTFAPASLTLNGALTATGSTVGGAVTLQSNGLVSLVSADTSSSGGHGGDITVTGAGLASGALTSSGHGGGAVTLTSSGALTVTDTIDSSSVSGDGGAVQLLTSATAAASLTPVMIAAINSSSSSGMGGFITVGPATSALAPSSLTVNSTLKSSGTNFGGSVRLTSGGAIHVTGAITTTATTMGSGGGVTILTTPGGAPGGDGLAGINATGTNGSGGNIFIGTDGTTAFAPASLTLHGAIATNGGSVNIVSNGALSAVAAATIDTAGTNGSGGNIAISNPGTGITLDGALTSTGSMQGGRVSVQSNGAISLASANTSSTGGNGGSITLNGFGLSSGALTSFGTTGGMVTLTSSGALTVTGTIDASATGAGNGGMVRLVTDATSAVTLTPVTTAAINSSSSGGQGGSISIGGQLVPTSITVNGALTSSAATLGGDIQLTAGGAIKVTGAITTGGTMASSAGAAVTILTTGGAVGGDTLAGISTAGPTGGGNIYLGADGGGVFAPASLTLTGAINTTSTGGYGGSVKIVSNGAILGSPAASINTSATNGSGGAIEITDLGTSLTLNGALTSSGVGGGAVTLTSGGALTVGNTINSSSTGTGNGGAVEILTSATAPGTLTPVTVAAINATATGGTGGLIDIGPEAGGALAPTSLTLNGGLRTTSPTTGAPLDDISLVTSGAITFNSGVNPFLLTGNTLLQAQTIAAKPAAALHFDLGGHNLTLTLTNNVTVDGVQGATTGAFNNVRNFVSNGPVTLDGAFITSGSQTYDDAVILAGGAGATRTLDATGTILFDGVKATIDGAPSLSIGAAGTTTQVVFDGTIGHVTPLNSLAVQTTQGTTFSMAVPTVNPAGVRLNNTLTVTGSAFFSVDGSSLLPADQRYSISTGGSQTYQGGGEVAFGSDTSLRTGTGGITFKTGLVGNGGLLLVFPGTSTFGAVVGGDAALASLTTAGGGTLAINGGMVITNGAQLYGGPVTLGLAGPGPETDLSAGPGGITFASTVASAVGTNPQALTITTPGVTTFDAQVGGAPGAAGSPITASPALASLTTLGGGEVDIHAGVTTLTTAGGAQSYGGLVKLTGNVTLKGKTLSLSSAGLSGQAGAFSLTLDLSGPAMISGLDAGLNNFASVGPGGTQIGGAFTTAGLQDYASAVTLTSAATLTSGGGLILFHSTVAGPFQLTLDPAAAGRVVFNGDVGGTTAAQHLAGLTVNGATTITGGGTVATTGGQDFTDTLILSVPATLTSSSGAVQVFPGGLAVLGNGNALTVDVASSSFGAINGGGNLNFTVASTGQAQFDSTVAATSLTVHGLAVLGGNVTTNSLALGQNYGALRLAANVTLLDAANGPLLFGKTVDGDGGRESLTTKTGGTTTFDGAVGSTNPLGSLTVTGAGTTVFDVAGGGVTVTTVNDGATASGGQTYDEPVRLELATTLSSLAAASATNGGAILFAKTVGSATATAENLTVLAGGGMTVFAPGATVNAHSLNIGGALVTFDQPVGAPNPIDVLTVGRSGNYAGTTNSVDLNSGIFTSTLGQIYSDAITLSANTTLTDSAAHDIVFNGSVNGAFSLKLSTGGNVDFKGTVGNGTALTALTVNAAKTTFEMSLAGLATGVAGVNVGTGGVTIDGPTVFAVPGSSLLDLTHPTVVSTGAQTYNGAVTLAQSTSLQGSGTGVILFKSTVDGDSGLAVNSPGNVIFDGLVGSGTSLTGLTADTLIADGGQTQFNMPVGAAHAGVLVNGAVDVGGPAVFNVAGSSLTQPSVLTSDNGAQTYAGKVSLAVNTVFASTNTLPPPGSAFTGGGAIDFTSSAGILSTGGSNLSVRTGAGATSFASALHAGSVDFGGGLASFGPVTLPGTFSVEPNAGGAASANVVQFNGGQLTTAGAQTFNVPVSLGADATLTSTSASAAGGEILFRSTLDGPHTLLLDTPGLIVFDGFVGVASPLTGLTAHTAARPGATQFNGTIGTLPAGVVVYGDVTVNGPVMFDLTGSNPTQPSILTLKDGAQTYNGAVTLAASTVFTSVTTLPGGAGPAGGGPILFGSSVTDSGAGPLLTLTVLTGAGTTTFGDTVNAFSLSATGAQVTFRGPVNLAGNLVVATNGGGTGGTIALNGGTVTTVSSQDYGSAVVLGADTRLSSLNSMGDGILTFASTIDGAHALTLATTQRTFFDGAVGLGTALTDLTAGEGGGATAVDGGAVRTSGFQKYDGVVTVSGPETSFTSTNGVITFTKTLDGALAGGSGVTLDAAAGNVVTGDIGDAASLADLTVSGPLSFAGAQVTTTGDQTYNGALSLAPAAGANTSLSAGGDVRFYNTVTAHGGMTVTASRIGAQGNITTAGDFNLDSTAPQPLLLLVGDRYVSTGGNVNFNTTPAYDPQGNASGAATIILTNPATTVIQGANFTVGPNQKIFSAGSLDLALGNGTATVGDLAARNDLVVEAGKVELLDHDATFSPFLGTSNTGLNIVAGNSINFGGAPIVFAGTGNRTASFVTTTGDTTIQQTQGVSLFKDAGLASQFDVALPDLATLDSKALIVFEPGRGGLEALDVAAALAGALPDQKTFDVQTDVTLTASQIEELKKLGIHPRLAQRSERSSVASKRALFAQLVDGEDPENYGRLQPIKGGVSRLEPSDYVVVVDRMGEREVQTILKGFEDLYGKNKEKAPEIGGAYQSAFNDYTVARQTADPAGFAPYLQGQPGKYPAVEASVRNFDKLFGQLEHLGLTDKEVAKSEEHIASDLGVSGLSPAEMVKTINTLRQKLTPAQKAASTKVPPSAPATNPAPGATVPAPNAQPAAVPAPTPPPEMIPEIPALPETPTAQPTPPPAPSASPAAENDVKPPDTASRRGAVRAHKVAGAQSDARRRGTAAVAAR